MIDTGERLFELEVICSFKRNKLAILFHPDYNKGVLFYKPKKETQRGKTRARFQQNRLQIRLDKLQQQERGQLMMQQIQHL